jgi:hypothetical protein
VHLLIYYKYIIKIHGIKTKKSQGIVSGTYILTLLGKYEKSSLHFKLRTFIFNTTYVVRFLPETHNTNFEFFLSIFTQTSMNIIPF